MISIHSCHTHA